MRNKLFSLIALSLALPALAAPPKRVEIAYEMSRNGTAFAELVERLEHDGKTYRLSAHMKGKGVFALRGDAERSSRGSIASDGLHPAEFEDKRSSRETVRAKFDWPGKTLVLEP